MLKDDGEPEMGVVDVCMVVEYLCGKGENEGGRCRARFVLSELEAKGRRWGLSSRVVLYLIAGWSSRLYRWLILYPERSNEIYKAKPALLRQHHAKSAQADGPADGDELGRQAFHRLHRFMSEQDQVGRERPEVAAEQYREAAGKLYDEDQ